MRKRILSFAGAFLLVPATAMVALAAAPSDVEPMSCTGHSVRNGPGGLTVTDRIGLRRGTVSALKYGRRCCILAVFCAAVPKLLADVATIAELIERYALRAAEGTLTPVARGARGRVWRLDLTGVAEPFAVKELFFDDIDDEEAAARDEVEFMAAAADAGIAVPAARSTWRPYGPRCAPTERPAPRAGSPTSRTSPAPSPHT